MSGSATTTATPVGCSIELGPGDDDPVSTVLRALAEAPVGDAHVWCDELDPVAEDTLRARLGADVVRTRELLQLVADLPLAAAHLDGLDRSGLGMLDPTTEADDWVRVNNAAFAWHPEQRDRTVADLRAGLAEPWVDPAGFLVHRSDDHLDGFCWTRVHPASADGLPAHGEIYVIGVDPAAHGRGLGRTLTIAGLDHLHRSAGVTLGSLWVEGDNDAALGLYRSLGFTEQRRRHALVVGVTRRDVG